jgi:hypothetical protein
MNVKRCWSSYKSFNKRTIKENKMADDNILREIQTDLKDEKYLRLITVHGKKLVIGAVAIVVFTAGLTVYKKHTNKKAREQGTLFIKAFEESDPKLYAPIVAYGQKGYAPMAALLKAKSERTSDKTAEAIKTLDGVINNSSYDKAFREKAALDKAFILIEKKGDKAEILKLLASATADGAVYQSTAQELQATYLMQIGDKKQAIEIFRMLAKDENSPATLQERAKNFLAVVE